MCQFRQMLLVIHSIPQLEYVKRKSEELNELIINDSIFFRNLKINLRKARVYKQLLWQEKMTVANHIFDPLLDPKIRLYNHLYQKSFSDRTNNPIENQYVFLLNYRWLEIYFENLNNISKSHDGFGTFYSFIYNFPPLEDMNYQFHIKNWVDSTAYLEFEKEKVYHLLVLWLKEFISLNEFQALDVLTDSASNVYISILSTMVKRHFTRQTVQETISFLLKDSPNKSMVEEILDMNHPKSWLSIVKK